MPRKGQAYAFDQSFRDAVTYEMNRIGWSRAELARRLGVTRGAVTQFFTTAKQSTLVPDIRELFGIGHGADAAAPEVPTSPRGPKEGPAWPATEDWKHAVMVALDERGWNQTDLARELASEIATTPAAISYMLTKAKQTSLRPFVDKLLGLAPHAATMPAAVPADSALLAELLNAWASLTPANRARLVERAQTLLEEQ